MTMNLWAALVGIGAAGLLLAAGYLFGIRRGTAARAALHHRLLAQDTAGRQQLRELARSLQQHESTQHELESDMRRFLDRVTENSTDTEVLRSDLRTLLAPVIERDRDDRSLRSAVRELVGPLVQRERIGYDLAHLNLGTGRRDELPRLLDEIAEKGGFANLSPTALDPALGKIEAVLAPAHAE